MNPRSGSRRLRKPRAAQEFQLVAIDFRARDSITHEILVFGEAMIATRRVPNLVE